jgi:hypothetical protein
MNNIVGYATNMMIYGDRARNEFYIFICPSPTTGQSGTVASIRPEQRYYFGIPELLEEYLND